MAVEGAILHLASFALRLVQQRKVKKAGEGQPGQTCMDRSGCEMRVRSHARIDQTGGTKYLRTNLCCRRDARRMLNGRLWGLMKQRQGRGEQIYWRAEDERGRRRGSLVGKH